MTVRIARGVFPDIRRRVVGPVASVASSHSCVVRRKSSIVVFLLSTIVNLPTKETTSTSQMGFQLTEEKRIKVWVDGYFQRNGKCTRGGVGVWFNRDSSSNHYRALYVSEENDQNYVKVMAAQRGLENIAELGRLAMIYTDSQFVIDNKDKLRSKYPLQIQRVDQDNEGICEANKLARMGASDHKQHSLKSASNFT